MPIFEVYGVIFSFHQIKETKQILIVAANNHLSHGLELGYKGLLKTFFICKRTIKYYSDARSKFIYCPNKRIKKYGVIEQTCRMSRLWKRNIKIRIFCPNCGHIPLYNIITNSYKVGDKVQISFNTNKVSGEIVNLTPVLQQSKKWTKL